METFLFTLTAIALLVAIVALIRWKVRRDWARVERSRVERDQATLKSYRARTTPGRKTSTPTGSATSAAAPDTYTSPAWDIPAMSAVHAPSAPTGLEPTIIGGGGHFSGGGASGGWEPSGCSGSDYSGSSDSGSSCSSSSGSD